MTREELNQELLKIHFKILDIYSGFDEKILNKPDVQEKLNAVLDKITDLKKEIEENNKT
jgi:hypothetical protein